MSRLFLLRHAKAQWADPGMKDFDRNLSPDGIEEAHSMGELMRARNLLPRTILCSSAARARQTLEHIDKDGMFAAITSFNDDLYATDAPGYLEIAARNGTDGDLMMIGHNPMLEDVAIGIGVEGDQEAIMEIQMGFGTACLAVIQIDGPLSGIETARGQLEVYLRPTDN